MKVLIKYKSLIYMLLIVFITGVFLTLSSANLLSHWLYKVSIVKGKLTAQTDFIRHDVAHHLTSLSQQFQQSHCDDKVLSAMRIAQYYSKRLHEYGFVINNQLLCSTSVGYLTKAQPQPNSDVSIVSIGAEFTRSSPVGILPGDETAMRLKLGNFQALIKSDLPMSIAVNGLYSSIFIYDGQRFLRVLSNDEHDSRSLMTEPSTQTKSTIVGHYWLHQFCYAPQMCALVKIDIRAFFLNNIWLIVISNLFILLLCITIFTKATAYLNQYYSFNNQVRRGMNSTQILSYYQPIICNETDRVSSCEVLCRWQDKLGTIYCADQFIKAVIHNQQEHLLTQIIITQAIAQFKHSPLWGKIKLSINCFPQDVASGLVYNLLVERLNPQELSNIVIEITEQQSAKHTNINQAIAKLRSLGVKIAIDDFGTGYANLEQLKNLHVDYLKIDRAFIIDILDNKLHRQLVHYIVKLAQEMSLECVAEGVETQAHQDIIPSFDIAYSQGFFHANPMPIDQLNTYITERNQMR